MGMYFSEERIDGGAYAKPEYNPTTLRTLPNNPPNHPYLKQQPHLSLLERFPPLNGRRCLLSSSSRRRRRCRLRRGLLLTGYPGPHTGGPRTTPPSAAPVATSGVALVASPTDAATATAAPAASTGRPCRHPRRRSSRTRTATRAALGPPMRRLRLVLLRLLAPGVAPAPTGRCRLVAAVGGSVIAVSPSGAANGLAVNRQGAESKLGHLRSFARSDLR